LTLWERSCKGAQCVSAYHQNVYLGVNIERKSKILNFELESGEDLDILFALC